MLVWCLVVDRFWNDATLLLCAVHFLFGFCGFCLNCSLCSSANFFQIRLILLYVSVTVATWWFLPQLLTVQLQWNFV